ncbi:MAG: acyl-CoA synthetase [Xanthomonadales bacterium]|nr:acyl-CoA synthetase [Xanthomonadales bacterium]
MAIANLDDIIAIEQTALAERDLPRNTYQMLARGAALNPDASALSFFLRAQDHDQPLVWTHADLLRSVTQTANLFRALGIGRHDVIAFILPNLPETHLTIWGGETAGIVFALNPLLETPQLAELLRAGAAKWLVTLAPTPGVDLWEKASAAAAQAPALQGVLTVNMAAHARGATRWALHARNALQPSKLPGSKVPLLDFHQFLKRQPDERLCFDPPQPDDLSSYFCTGGTTGLPKIAVRTQHAEVFDAWAMNQFLPGAAQPGKNIFCGLPLFHVNGQLVTGLYPWSTGAHVVLGTPQGYRGDGVMDQFWSIVERHRIHFFSGVPTVYSTLLSKPNRGHDISSLEYGLCGAAPMPVELFRQFQARTGVRILEGYGLTEGACASSVNPPGGEPRIGSIGLRYPYQDMRVLILDERGDYLRDGAIDEVGVIAIRGPNVFRGYLDPEQTQAVWINRPATTGTQRWLNTGDLGRQDAHGYFWLTGRNKELIIRGGHNIDPKLLEEPMHKHPAVALAAAIGCPDAHAGEVPVLYVQLMDHASATESELEDWARLHVAERAAHPKRVHIIEAMPVTPVGKIYKPALSMLAIEDVVRREAKQAGISLERVDVSLHPQHGLSTRIICNDANAALSAALGRYAFKVTIACRGG